MVQADRSSGLLSCNVRKGERKGQGDAAGLSLSLLVGLVGAEKEAKTRLEVAAWSTRGEVGKRISSMARKEEKVVYYARVVGSWP